MNVMIFDTETTSLEKLFCYNIGYVIADTDTKQILCQKDFVVEQIWHNLELFNSAYYADKRPIYVKRLRGRTTKMNKYGYICREMIKDIKTYDVQGAYAYNSTFDEKVFNFNCDWYKSNNPFDTIPIFDIRGYVHKAIAFSEDFQHWCEDNQAFTESGNYSTTAENIYRYLFQDISFQEEHTALADSQIEWEILKCCLNDGLKVNQEYTAYKSIPRNQIRKLTIVDKSNDNAEYDFFYKKKTVRKDKIFLTLD